MTKIQILSYLLAFAYAYIGTPREMSYKIFFMIGIILDKFVNYNKNKNIIGPIFETIAYFSLALMIYLNSKYFPPNKYNSFQDYQLKLSYDEMNQHLEMTKSNQRLNLKLFILIIDIVLWSLFRGLAGLYLFPNMLLLKIICISDAILDFLETTIYIHWIIKGYITQKYLFNFWRITNILKHHLYWITVIPVFHKTMSIIQKNI